MKSFKRPLGNGTHGRFQSSHTVAWATLIGKVVLTEVKMRDFLISSRIVKIDNFSSPVRMLSVDLLPMNYH